MHLPLRAELNHLLLTGEKTHSLHSTLEVPSRQIDENPLLDMTYFCTSLVFLVLGVSNTVVTITKNTLGDK